MLKRLWLIFGSLLTAICLVIVTIVAFPTHLPHNLRQEKRNAVALTDTSFKNGVTKKQALADKHHHFMPFFGSSEWSRMDSMHPSVLAERYHRPYIPYLIGKRGTQSLSQYYSIMQMLPELRNQKAVFVISPQWFSPQGTEITAVQKYMSNSQVISFLLQAHGNDPASQMAAKRLLHINPGVVFNTCLKKISRGQDLSALDKNILKVSEAASLREETMFSHFSSSDNYEEHILPRVAGLPKTFSYERLHVLATRRGQEGTNNNRFRIQNFFYTKRIAPGYRTFKNFQSKNSYIVSPEYNDFQLVLDAFAKQDMQVLFVITPVNQEWAKYTGLNMDKYQAAVKKIKYQLESQGFTDIADLSKKGGEPYFMQDTIHIGWNGWLAFDEHLQAFLAKKTDKPNYDIHPYFFSKEWANLNNPPVKESPKQ
ncbi:D-alanyl-lipoteichoic acid biosynthesis protein DltD [Streptococcus halichoeri]|uniref:D-alanyl-lipoteichoic acid biosynthesis protein DltD n=1 Tax=Streptococcus halichoeri TaxID=254785 RepID=UPI00135C8BFF|nr:D-alanyl-lipoteichoic acid biosynthesis protein DltD [Streptococcus halichoeri]